MTVPESEWGKDPTHTPLPHFAVGLFYLHLLMLTTVRQGCGQRLMLTVTKRFPEA